MEQDGTSISVVYNPLVDVVELNNVADGTATIDSAGETPISDLVSRRPQFLNLPILSGGQWLQCERTYPQIALK